MARPQGGLQADAYEYILEHPWCGITALAEHLYPGYGNNLNHVSMGVCLNRCVAHGRIMWKKGPRGKQFHVVNKVYIPMKKTPDQPHNDHIPYNLDY